MLYLYKYCRCKLLWRIFKLSSLIFFLQNIIVERSVAKRPKLFTTNTSLPMKIKLKKNALNVVIKIKSLPTLERMNSCRALERMFTKNIGRNVHKDNVKNNGHQVRHNVTFQRIDNDGLHPASFEITQLRLAMCQVSNFHECNKRIHLLL